MNEQRSGWVTFAGVMLLIAGVLNVIYGIAAIGDSNFFINDTKYILSNLNTWGWITPMISVIQPQVLRLLRMYFESLMKNFESPIAAIP